MRFGIKTKIKSAFVILTGCKILKKTQWYRNMLVDPDHEIYPDNTWYRTHDERNFDIVNLGSSGGKWAFDYSDLDLKAINWAQQPQTLLEDYNLLRHYHSILRKGGYVIITIMPFTGLNKETGLLDAFKYVNLDCQGEPIQPHMYNEACRYAKYPILFKKKAIKALIRYLLGKESNADKYAYTKVVHNPMSHRQLDEDAKRWIDGWKRQFGIDDFDAPLTTKNQEGRIFRINLMRELIDFCLERGYKPVYVIPPVTSHLSCYYTQQFESTYVYGFLKEVNREIPLLDYSKDETFKDDDLYFNSFFLNLKGRKMFTLRVIQDLGGIANK